MLRRSANPALVPSRPGRGPEPQSQPQPEPWLGPEAAIPRPLLLAQGLRKEVKERPHGRGITVSPGLSSRGQQLGWESLGRNFQFCLGAGSNPKPGSFSRLNNLAWSDRPWESIPDGDQAPSALIKTGDCSNYKWSFVGHSPSRSPAAQAIRPMGVVIRYADLQQGPRGLHSPARQVVGKFFKVVSPSPFPACPPLISPSGTA